MSRPAGSGHRPAGARPLMFLARVGAPGLVVLLAVLALLAALAPAAPGAAAGEETLPVRVLLDTLAPGSPAPGDTLVVTGRLVNTGTTALASVDVGLRLDTARMTTQDAVTAWVDRGLQAFAGQRLTGALQTLDAPLGPGAQVAFRLEARPDALAALLRGGAFGPRGLAVVATWVDGRERRRAGLVRTFVVWNPDEVRPSGTSLTLLVPVVSGVPSRDADAADAAVLSQFAAEGRLTRVVRAVSGSGADLVVDPALLSAASVSSASAPSTPSSSTPSPSASPPSTPSAAVASPQPSPPVSSPPPPAPDAVTDGARWLGELRIATQGRELLTLPWADPDLAALARASAVPLVDLADERAAATVLDVLGSQADAGIAWPVEGLADDATLATARRTGRTAVVLSASSVQVAPGPDAGGNASVATTAGQVIVLRADAQLSRAFTQTGSADQQVLGTQRMLAELGLAATAGPGPPRRAVAVSPRAWNPAPDAVRTALDTLRETGWVQPTGGAALRAGGRPPAAVVTYPDDAAGRELPATHVTAVAGASGRLTAFAPALPDPGPVVDPLRDNAMSLVSAAWRGSSALRLATARAGLVTGVSDLYAGVGVVPGSRVLLLAASAELPIRVSNELPHPVTVDVVLRARSGLLTAQEPVRLDVPASGDAVARVPVRTVASGDVEVEAALYAPDGPQLGTPQVMEVRVRRTWESRGLMAAGGVLAVLLLTGLVRSARRGRLRVPPEDAPDFDLLAAARESREDAERARQSRLDALDRSSVDIGRSSALMASGTLVSRILGFVRASLLAAAIGAGTAAGDAFAVANTVPNIIFLLLSGGVVNAVLVPQITRAAREPDGGREYVDRLVTVSIALVFVVTVLATAAAPLVVGLYTDGSVSAGQLSLSIAFAFWCLPQIFFYGLYAVWGQILNARGAFGAFTWAPVVNNVVAIAGLLAFVAVVGFGPKGSDGWTPWTVALLGGTATLGIVAQALVLLPVLRRVGFRWTPRWGLRGVGLGRASRVAGWTFASLVLSQAAFVVTTQVLTAAGEQSRSLADPDLAAGLTIYNLAFLLFMLPHSIVTVSLVTALFTRMSRSAAAGDVAGVRDDLSLGLRITWVAAVPATALMLAMGTAVVTVLFPGNTSAEVRGIAYGAAAMLLGLAPFSAQYLLQRVYYAFEDARTPFLIQVPTVLVSTAGVLLTAAVLPANWRVVGVGLAMATANLLGATVSALVLRRRLGSLDASRVALVLLRVMPAAAVAGVAAWAVSQQVLDAAADRRLTALWALMAGGVVMAAVYVGLLLLLRVRELGELTASLTGRWRRPGAAAAADEAPREAHPTGPRPRG